MKRIALLLCVILLVGCKSAPNSKSVTLYVMDTSVALTCYGQNAESCLSACSTRLLEIERELDMLNVAGSVYALNHSGGEWTELSFDAYEALELSLKYAELTHGAFDPTIGSILLAWDDFSGDVVPIEEERLLAASSCDYRLVELDKATRRARLGTNQLVALGAIGKGYATDALVDIYVEYGCTGIIDLGGNIYTVGTKENKQLFNIGVRSPFDENALITTVAVGDSSVITSGAYERNFTVGDAFYHHIFDPSNGSPAQSDLASVTIISKDAAMADAYSTAVFVMGFEKGQSFLLSQGVQAILVKADGSIVEVNP